MAMDENYFENKLHELVNEIGSVTPSQKLKLETLAHQTNLYHKKLKKSVDNLQESLDYLRVSIKYLLFDLEATKRENTYLKTLIEGDQK
jgi:hypothetical protein